MQDVESSPEDQAFAQRVAETLHGIMKYPAYRGPHPSVWDLQQQQSHPDDGWEFRMQSSDGGACYVNIYPALGEWQDREEAKTSSPAEAAVCPRCGMRTDDPGHETLPDGCRGRTVAGAARNPDGFMSCPCGRGDYDACSKCPYPTCSVHGAGLRDAELRAYLRAAKGRDTARVLSRAAWELAKKLTAEPVLREELRTLLVTGARDVYGEWRDSD